MIGLGTDLVDVERFRRTLARTPSMVERLFTEGERGYAEATRDPTERYAVRFAAKEAVMKALGVGLGAFDWHDVEVIRTGSGAPELRITGRAAELASAAGVTRWAVSLSHTGSTAQAVVVAQ
ncbi:MAG: holo-ACP synthase [Acidimicrobiales bacterium]|nr:holo-ACP synthase [Acidimicrobiales bacterium]